MGSLYRLVQGALLPLFGAFPVRIAEKFRPLVPFCIRQICGRCRDSAAVSWRHPEVAQISAQKISFCGRGSFSSATHEQARDFFHGNAIAIHRNSWCEEAGHIVPRCFLFAVEAFGRVAQFASRLRFILSRSFAFGMFEIGATGFKFRGWNSGLRHVGRLKTAILHFTPQNG